MKRFIDFIVVGVVLSAITIASVNIIKKSYDEYQVYYKENYPEIDPCDNATLLGINVEFKAGVRYYKNNKAKPIRDDFVVMGTWQEDVADGKTFEHPLDPVKRPYELTYSDFFSSQGGDITVSYQGFSQTLNVELLDVKLEKLEVEHGPYKYKYAYGEYFDKTGIVAYAVYNDGEKVLLTDEDIFVDNNHALTTSDKEAIVAYTDGGISKSAIIKIEVKQTLNDGKVVKIGSDGRYGSIYHGHQIDTADIDVCATYQSGNKKLLTTYDYSIENKTKKGHLGVQNYAVVSYKEDPSIIGKIPLKVISRIQGEDGYIIGGSRKTEKEYIFDNGTFTEVGNVTFGGNFGKTVTEGREAYATYTMFTTAPGNVDLVLRCGNSNLFKDGLNFYMRPLQINTIMDLYVNEEKVNIDDNVILGGCGPNLDDAPLYNVYSAFTFKDIPFKVGLNKVSFKFKPSTIGELTYYDETPSTLNIDYVDVIANGLEIADDIKFKEAYIDPTFRVLFGDNFDYLNIPIYGVYGTENRKIIITDKFAEITKPEGYASIGTHKIKVDLYHNPSLSFEKTFTVSDLVLEAENATIKGTSKITNTTEAEYVLDPFSNKYEKGDDITVVKGMDNSATNHGVIGETSLTFSFNAAPGSHRLYVRASNTNFFVGSNNRGYTKSIDMNTVIDIYVNGKKVSYSAILPSITDSEHDDWCWMGFFLLDTGLIDLVAGKNTIKLQAKTGSGVPKNKWDEYAIPRFDYIKISNP